MCCSVVVDIFSLWRELPLSCVRTRVSGLVSALTCPGVDETDFSLQNEVERDGQSNTACF